MQLHEEGFSGFFVLAPEKPVPSSCIPRLGTVVTQGEPTRELAPCQTFFEGKQSGSLVEIGIWLLFWVVKISLWVLYFGPNYPAFHREVYGVIK